MNGIDRMRTNGRTKRARFGLQASRHVNDDAHD